MCELRKYVQVRSWGYEDLKIVLLGWQELGKYGQNIDWQDVKAVVGTGEDAAGNGNLQLQIKNKEREFCVPVISLAELKNIDYDYLLVLSQEYFRQIVLQLG